MAVWRIFARYSSSGGDLIEKSNRVLELVRVDTRRLRNNRDVVVYKRNRTCPDCSREIRIAEPEFAENACSHAWRYFHGFSQKCPCPLIGVMRFTRFGKLRLEQRVRLEK
ncbi:hypothetical protein X943_001749 [Babesia divergens]|uniref:Uncharacterized protein n=1 Tax=Babesia divergens TaxID=32595 RepID=A0AAD9GFG9_BABDI|nr:hypothetical protein X943_001749 [Babesia divergens]